MSARLTLGLVLAAAATLILGFVSHTALLIYVSIGCSALAAAGLILSSRRTRGGSGLEEELAWPASLAAPDGEAFASGNRDLPTPPPRSQVAFAASLPPRRRTVGTTLTIPTTAERLDTEPDPDDDFLPDDRPGRPVGDEPQQRQRPPKRNPVVSDWIQAPPPPPRPAPAPVGAEADAVEGARVAPAPAVPARAAAARAAAARPVAPAPAVPARATAARPVAPAPAVPARATAARSGGPVAAAPRSVAPAPASARSVVPVRAAVTAPASPARAAARQPLPRPIVRAAAQPAPRGPAERRPAARGPAATSSRGRPTPAPAEDFPFPIEDYDVLHVAEILPLLPELDDQELVEILLREQGGANRVAIINRIDALLEGDE
ncbi:MAG: hypothetical protein QOF30_854 [Acidimicrobiaceae bacterium]|nr:hypothetical protein [Acidimicrobiaceae bacterium]